jgi:hypothetical protein
MKVNIDGTNIGTVEYYPACKWWGNFSYEQDYGHDGFDTLQEAYDDLIEIHNRKDSFFG